jgi:hypothetical protein
MISTSEIKISVVIPKSQSDEAIRVLHREFGLERETAAPAARPAPRSATRRRAPPAGRGRR